MNHNLGCAEVFLVVTAFGWAMIGIVALVFLGAAVFILGFLLSMLVSIGHGLGLGVEHLAERGIHHGSGHPGAVALHH